MNLEIQSIKYRSDIDEERILLNVLENCNVGDYLIVLTKKIGDSISIKMEKGFWFPNKEVKKSDLVVLYTKKGRMSEKDLSNGRKSHFFYWDQTQPLFEPIPENPEMERTGAVLFEAKINNAME